MTRDDFIASCRTYLGTRYWHKGRSRTGVDCSGLVVAAARDLGLTVYDDTDYQEHVDAGRFRAALLRNCYEIPWAQARPGDLLLFRSRDGNPQHLAVLTSPRTMIHAWDAADKVCEHPINRGWRDNLETCFRWKDW